MPKYFKPEETQDWKKFISSSHYENFSQILHKDKNAIYDKFISYFESINSFIQNTYPNQK
jgi:hypothetical protein